MIHYGSNRRVGRSTATLKNALEVLKSGSDVTYVSTSHKHSELLCALARELLYQEIDPPGAYAGNYKFQSTSILHGPTARLQFLTLEDTRRGSRSVVVPDHAAYELVEDLYWETKRESGLIKDLYQEVKRELGETRQELEEVKLKLESLKDSRE